jgi:hypothetical protein
MNQEEKVNVLALLEEISKLSSKLEAARSALISPDVDFGPRNHFCDICHRSPCPSLYPSYFNLHGGKDWDCEKCMVIYSRIHKLKGKAMQMLQEKMLYTHDTSPQPKTRFPGQVGNS